MIRMELFHNSFICDHLTRTKPQISRRDFWKYFVVYLFVCLFVWSGVQLTLCHSVRFRSAAALYVNILTSYADDFYFQNNQKIPLWWLKTMIRMKLFHNSFICDHLTRTKPQISRRNFWNYFVVCLFVYLFVCLFVCLKWRSNYTVLWCKICLLPRGWSLLLIYSLRSVCHHNWFGLCL